MVHSTLTPDRATPTLLLMHQSLYKWKPTKWRVCVCVLQNVMKGGLYRGLGLVPSPQQGQFHGGGRPGSHHVVGQPCVVEIPPQLLRILPCRFLETIATKSQVSGRQSGVGRPPFWAHLIRAWSYVSLLVS
jgi:hypothetical protein